MPNNLNISIGEIGYGHHVAFSPDGGAFTNVVQLVDCNGPDVQVPPVKITNTDSPNAAHEKIPGLVDAGQATLNCIYATAGLAALASLCVNRTMSFWKITYNDGHVWLCTAGFITKISQSSPLEDRETIDVTLEWSGKPSYT